MSFKKQQNQTRKIKKLNVFRQFTKKLFIKKKNTFYNHQLKDMQQLREIESLSDYEVLLDYIENLALAQTILVQYKLNKIIQGIIKIIKSRKSNLHAKQLPLIMAALHHKLEEFKEEDQNACEIQCQLLFKLILNYETEFKMSVRGYKYERKKKNIKKKKVREESNLSVVIKNSINEDHYSKKKCSAFEKNTNKLAHDMLLNKYPMPDPINLCCSQVYYLDLFITHSGLAELPFMILNPAQSEQRKEIQRNICALLNEKRGGVILLGCTLYEDEDSLKIQKIDKKYLDEKNRKYLNDVIKRCSGVFQPLPCQRERKILLEFVPVYKNPLTNPINDIKQAKAEALLPRITVVEQRSEVPKYIKVERKSYHTIYESYYCKKLHENSYEYKILEGEQSYKYLFEKFKNKGQNKKKIHNGNSCIPPLNYDVVEKVNLDQEEKKLQLKDCGELWKFEKKMKSIFTSNLGCISIIYGNIEKQEEKLAEILQEIEAKRVEFKIMKVFYQNSITKKVAVLIAHDHTAQLIKQTIKENTKNKNFDIESITTKVKLAMLDNDKNILTKYGDWDKFYNIYGKNFDFNSAQKKCTYSTKNKTKQFLFFDSLIQAALGFILLDKENARPVFVADNLPLGNVQDLKI